MKKSIVYSFLFLLATQSIFSQEDFRKNAPKPGPAPRIELGKAEQWTLKNGLKVIVVENHKLPRISFQIFVDAPPVLEGEAAGYVDMAGQLLTKGTTTKTKSQIDEAVDFIGASLSSDANGVNGTCLSKHRVKLLELMSDVLLNPTFPEEEFVKLKKQTLSALAQAKDDPNTIAGNVGATLRNGKKHPYGEVESEATIDKVTSEKCKAYFQTYFKPGISYLVVTGDITAAEVKKLATKYFGDWKQAPVNKETFPHPKKPATTQVDFVDKTGAVQSVVYITYPVEFKPGQEDAIKADVMNTVLGAYFSSRLNANLREDKGYTYGAGSRLVNDPVIGNFRASASVRNEVTDSSITQFLLEINKLKSEEIGDAEMNMVKNVMTGNFARSLEDPATVARFTLNTARFNLPADYYHTYLERLSKVTKQGVLAMAKKYLTPENAHILVVGNKDEVAKKLTPFVPNGQKINYFDVYGNPLDMDGLSIPTGVTAETVLADYLAALGKPEDLKALKSVKMVSTADLQGMTIESTLSHKAPNKLNMAVSMMGSTVQETTFDGEKGTQSQMGQSAPMEGEDLENMKVDSRLFPERFYKELGVMAELSGIEMVNGKKAYKVVATYPSGTKKTAFYDVETSLKAREIETAGEGMVITNDLSDYKAVSGIKFPHVVTISGAMPIPMKLEVKSIEVNGQLADEVFKVE